MAALAHVLRQPPPAAATARAAGDAVTAAAAAAAPPTGRALSPPAVVRDRTAGGRGRRQQRTAHGGARQHRRDRRVVAAQRETGNPPRARRPTAPPARTPHSAAAALATRAPSPRRHPIPTRWGAWLVAAASQLAQEKRGSRLAHLRPGRGRSTGAMPDLHAAATADRACERPSALATHTPRRGHFRGGVQRRRRPAAVPLGDTGGGAFRRGASSGVGALRDSRRATAASRGAHASIVGPWTQPAVAGRVGRNHGSQDDLLGTRQGVPATPSRGYAQNTE